MHRCMSKVSKFQLKTQFRTLGSGMVSLSQILLTITVSPSVRLCLAVELCDFCLLCICFILQFRHSYVVIWKLWLFHSCLKDILLGNLMPKIYSSILSHWILSSCVLKGISEQSRCLKSLHLFLLLRLCIPCIYQGTHTSLLLYWLPCVAHDLWPRCAKKGCIFKMSVRVMHVEVLARDVNKVI